MSPSDIERRTGLQRVQISSVENGHTVASIKTLKSLHAHWEFQCVRFFRTAKSLQPQNFRRLVAVAGEVLASTLRRSQRPRFDF